LGRGFAFLLAPQVVGDQFLKAGAAFFDASDNGFFDFVRHDPSRDRQAARPPAPMQKDRPCV